MSVRRVPGNTLSNNNTGEVIYTPPEGDALLRELLANWERFLHEEETIEPLVRMAAAHYQFDSHTSVHRQQCTNRAHAK